MIDASAAIYEDIRESVDPGIYEAYMGLFAKVYVPI